MRQTIQYNKWIVTLAILCIFAVPYAVTNAFPIIELPGTFILGEENIPFLWWSVFIYISVFVQIVVVVRSVPYEVFRNAVPLIGFMLFMHIFTYVFVPIRYPRENFVCDNSFVCLIRSIDLSGNTFPSCHVSISVFLSIMYLYAESSTGIKASMWVWTILIGISVLTFKQHYVIDVIAGVIIAAGPFALRPYALWPKYQQMSMEEYLAYKGKTLDEYVDDVLNE